MYNFNILTHWAEVKADEMAYVDENGGVTFAQLNSHVRKTANFLAQAGVARGDLVCTVLPSYFGWVFTLALHLLGTTSMTRNLISPFELDQIPNWLISPRLHPQIPASHTFLLNNDLLDRINSGDELSVAPGYKDPSNPARIVSTSGSSGTAKNVVITIGELAEIPGRASTYDLVGEDHVISLYAFGARQSYRRALKCLTLGKTFYACEATDRRLVNFLNKYPIRTLLGSPTQVSMLLDIQDQAGVALPNLKTVILGGTAPSQIFIERLRKNLDCKIYDAYGSTEGSAIAIREINEDFLKGAQIIPEVTVEIVDDNDQQMPVNKIGRIRYRRNGIATSYYKNPVATTEFFKDGYFYPGDQGFLDEAGLLHLAGRINELINLGGVKVNPEKVDEITQAQLGVLDCAAFALPMPSGIEELAIAVVANQDFDLARFTESLAAKSPVKPTLIITVARIPRNENGKILRVGLAREFAAHIPESITSAWRD